MDSVSIQWIEMETSQLTCCRSTRSHRHEQCDLSRQMGGIVVISQHLEVGQDIKHRTDPRVEVSTKRRVMISVLQLASRGTWRSEFCSLISCVQKFSTALGRHPDIHASSVFRQQ